MPWPLKSDKNEPATIVASPEKQPEVKDKSTEIQESLASFMQDFASFKDSIENRFSTVESKLIEGSKSASPTNNTPQADEMADFWTDPEKAVNQRIVPVLKQTLELRASMAYDKVSQRFGKEWAWFKDEIDGYLKQAPLVNRADENYVENVFRVTRDRHREDIAAGKYNNLLDGKAGTVEAKDDELPPEQQLTPAELSIAKKWNLDPKEYLANKRQMNSPAVNLGRV